MLTRVLISFGLACSLCMAIARAETDTSPIGSKVSDFTLDNCYGKSVSLNDFADNRLVVIAFLGTECPLAKLYGPRLNEIQSKFGDDGVVVIGVNANKQDSLTELAAYVHRHKISFPMLKDVGSRVADAMGAQRTPEVFLLDHDRVVRYHGRIDDQYGVGYSRDKTVHPDLAVAILELLEGGTPSVAQTEVVGCHIGRIKETDPTGDITYTKHIAPIFNARCVSCHREQEIAPFTLGCYDDVLGWEDTILEVIDDNRMPPWFANPSHGKFANDARMTDQEKELIAMWIDNGMPQGDSADLPQPPKFTTGWRIPHPDQVIKMQNNPFTVPAEGVVDYQHFVIDPDWDEDKYIYAAEARPQNRSVVHHILVYVIPPGKREHDLSKILAGYAPGSLPVVLTDGVAMHVRAGSKLLFEMHYTPNGSEQSDLSYVGFCFKDESEVNKLLQGRVAIERKFEIPARESNHPVTAQYPPPPRDNEIPEQGLKEDVMLLSMTPHMHLRGKSFRYTAHYPDARTEVLLDVPKYDFNWQLKYILDEPKRLPRGTKIVCTAVFDNSDANLSNPNPDRPVKWGKQSFDEMMIGFMETVSVEGE